MQNAFGEPAESNGTTAKYGLDGSAAESDHGSNGTRLTSASLSVIIQLAEEALSAVVAKKHKKRHQIYSQRFSGVPRSHTLGPLLVLTWKSRQDQNRAKTATVKF